MFLLNTFVVSASRAHEAAELEAASDCQSELVETEESEHADESGLGHALHHVPCPCTMIAIGATSTSIPGVDHTQRLVGVERPSRTPRGFAELLLRPPA